MLGNGRKVKEKKLGEELLALNSLSRYLKKKRLKEIMGIIWKIEEEFQEC